MLRNLVYVCKEHILVLHITVHVFVLHITDVYSQNLLICVSS